MAQLRDLARVIRSKNAGPFYLTFDVMFATLENYERVRRARVITPETFAGLFGVNPGWVEVIEHPASLSIKATLPRPVPAGDLDDTDLYGTMQYVPLISLEVPE